MNFSTRDRATWRALPLAELHGGPDTETDSEGEARRRRYEEACGSKDKKCIFCKARVVRSWEELAAQGHKSGEEPWAHQCLYSRYHNDARAWRYLKAIEWKPPEANEDLSITIHKCVKKKAVKCLVCGNHQPRARRTCILCKDKRALPSCKPEFCWMQIDDKMGACRMCFLEFLQDKCGEPAAIIMSMVGERYGAVKRRRTKPPRDVL